MALTTGDINNIHEKLRERNIGWNDLKIAGVTRNQLKLAYDALDNIWESNRVAIKNAMDSAAGVTFTNALAKKIGKAWMIIKLEGE